MKEQTFVMVKPDGVQRRCVGDIVGRFEKKGLKIVAMKLLMIGRPTAEELYSVHKGKIFYDGLVAFATSSPAVVMVIEGHRAVATVRKILGATYGYDAEPGTIRGDFGCSKGFNLVHGSDSIESARREIPLFFQKEEIVSYNICDADWVNDSTER